jgi:N-acetylmuramoyl-L-alanine amidase
MRTLLATLLITCSLPLYAQQVDVLGARIWTEPDQTRLVVDTAAAVTHKVFALENPHRLVVDIPDARLSAKLPVVEPNDPLLAGVRSGIRDGDDLRLVLDLKQTVRAKSFLLEPNDQYGHRVVVELMPTSRSAPSEEAGKHLSIRAAPKKAREVIIAIDRARSGPRGHGRNRSRSQSRGDSRV